mgnify:CR=1 FL=1
MDINVRAFGNENFTIHFFLYPDNANPQNGQVPTYGNLGIYDGTVSFGTATGVDPNLDPMYTEEALVGFELRHRHQAHDLLDRVLRRTPGRKRAGGYLRSSHTP